MNDEQHTERIKVSEQKLALAARHYENLKTYLWISIGVITLLVLLLQLLILDQNRELTQGIAECSTPGGECYERQQEQTANAVRAIIEETQNIQNRGSAPSRYNVALTEANSVNIALICEALGLECVDPPLDPAALSSPE